MKDCAFQYATGDGSDYHTTAEHWCGQDFTVRDGEMFSLIAVA